MFYAILIIIGAIGMSAMLHNIERVKHDRNTEIRYPSEGGRQ